jgi:hypothetical protein
MPKSDDKTIYVILIIIGLVIFWYGGSHGWFNFNFNFGTPKVPSDPPNQYYTYSNTIDIQPRTICVGDSVTGTIQANIPNGICSVFINTGSGWEWLMNANLNANGFYTISQVMNTVGILNARAVCCDVEGNCRVSNVVGLTVLPLSSPQCSDAPDGQEDGGDGGLVCTDTDSGNDIFHYGVCTDDTHSIQDNCQFSNMVNENWCQDGVCMGASVYCPEGYHCWEGACILIQEGERDCALITNPTSQSSCSSGICQFGVCTYFPATVYSIARCGCVS